MHAELANHIAGLPNPGDPDAATRGLEDWLRVAETLGDRRTEAVSLAGDGQGGKRLLVALFGNSPFLSRCALQQPELLLDIVADGVGSALERLLNETAYRPPGKTVSDTTVMRALRQARQRAALLVAVADLAQIWDGPRATEALSRFAEIAISHATDHLLRRGAESGDLDLPDLTRPGRGSGLVILGMGKLGGRELNYSSDVDLIVLFDEGRARYRGAADMRSFFIRLAGSLAKLLEERTADGYVFRTDLRLRPDPAATPPAVSVAAAENYYASLGQNWERAAMIKARPIAGDIAAGEAFLAAIRPFIWRKHLDFAAIQDIHSIKRQIRSHRGSGLSVRGHNVKLGRGGIREIEFFTQTQQLIWGGRYPSLRERRTEDALHALRALERITSDEEAMLVDSYWHLRRTEHRLQMMGDRQTHTVPKDEAGFAHVAAFLGHDDASEFERSLTEHLTRVADHCERLFEDAPALGGPTPGGGSLAFTSADDDPGTLQTLAQMGFRQGTAVSRAIRAWHHGRLRATRSTRARELLTELTPSLLAALARTANPDQAFARFDLFLANLPAGVQLFSLFHAAPGLLDLVAEIVGSAPRIADYLSRHANLFDAALAQGFYDELPGRAALAATLDRELQAAGDLQDRLEIARDWAAAAKFQVGVQQLLGYRDIAESSHALSAIADVLIEAMLQAVQREFARRHGTICGGALAVIGLGKLGSRLLTRGSDLDLVFVYRAPDPKAESDGARPLAAPVYYARLCQRLITALSVQTGSGRLYEVDMRLRPMGKDGPLASEINAFERYCLDAAWTWELMALTRARVVAAPAQLGERLTAVIERTLTRPRDPAALAADISDMRARLEREYGTEDPFAIKYVRGGLIDVEFIAQFLQLRDAAMHPGIVHANTFDAFEALARVGSLDGEAAADLIAAAELLYAIQAMRRLTLDGPLNERTAPEGLRRALSRAGGVSDFGALKARLMDVQARVHRHYAEIVETRQPGFSRATNEEEQRA